GKDLVRKSADTMKKLSLELGGHAPFIVFEDADLEKTAEDLIASKFRNAGQTSVCTNRVYVHENIMESFSEVFERKMKKLVVGNGLESGVTIGPLIDSDVVGKVEGRVEDTIEKGEKVIVEGELLVE